MLNKVFLIGNLGSDPETRFMQDGTCVCNISLATTEKFKDRNGKQQERTEWHKVELWGRLGEIADQYLKKGSRVYIEGMIRTDKWQDREGQDRYTTKIRAKDMKMIGGNGDSASQGGRQQREEGSGNDSPAGSHRGSQQRNSDPFADSPDFGDVPYDDDIPFYG